MRDPVKSKVVSSGGSLAWWMTTLPDVEGTIIGIVQQVLYGLAVSYCTVPSRLQPTVETRFSRPGFLKIEKKISPTEMADVEMTSPFHF